MSPIVYIGNICIAAGVGFSLFGMIAFFTHCRVRSGAAGAAGAASAAFGRGAVYGNFLLMTVANFAMVWALLGNDFGVSYVSHVGSLETPRWVSAISLWSSLEGSILFWGWILSAYSAACLYLHRQRRQHRQAGETFFSWVGLTLLAVQIFFFILLALPANPFLPVHPVPANGPGPNPLLQNHWLMTLHPPCLYIGYIGFTIPFAFAIAQLFEAGPVAPVSPGSARPPPADCALGGGPPPVAPPASAEWSSLSRRWTLFAWSFLSIAIVLGGWWSYAVLGWGGYWAWDPVENASFMPWLSGTALIHSVMVQEKRKMLSAWNLMLAILTFLLTLLGTFLTRSGILDSVHSFTESHIGPYFLVFIGLILSVSLALLLWAGPRERQTARFENLFSLEFLFLFNNLLFLSFCFVVFLGTLYPLVIEAVEGKRISVGEPYFNQMSAPIVGMILLLMGIGLLTPWKSGSGRRLWEQSRIPGLLAGAVTGTAWLLGARSYWVTAFIFLAAFAFLVMLFETVRQTRRRSFSRLFLDNPRRYGGFVAHVGALTIIVAVALSSAYEREQEVTLREGESAAVQNYTLTLEGLRAEHLRQRFEIKAAIDVSRKGRPLGRLFPRMNFYPNAQEPIGSPAIRSTIAGDLYLTLMHFEKDGSAASLRVIVAPAVSWIWAGGGIVLLGGLASLAFGCKNEES